MLDRMPLERPRPPLPIPRGLVFVASGWITVSWIFAMGLEPPLQPSSSVYTPAARMLLCSLVIGGMVGWPLVRLCSAIPRRPIASALMDVVTLTALLQVLLWPLRLVTSWPIARTLLIDVHGIIWLLITGGVIAIATAKEGAIRIWMMLLLLTWLGLPPLLSNTFELPLIVAKISPLSHIWLLASGGPGAPPPGAWQFPIVELAIAMVLWWVAFPARTPVEVANPRSNR